MCFQSVPLIFLSSVYLRSQSLMLGANICAVTLLIYSPGLSVVNKKCRYQLIFLQM